MNDLFASCDVCCDARRILGELQTELGFRLTSSGRRRIGLKDEAGNLMKVAAISVACEACNGTGRTLTQVGRELLEVFKEEVKRNLETAAEQAEQDKIPF